MKVLILSQYFYPEPDLKCLPLARYLRAQGHEVQVLTGYPNYPGGVLYDGYRLRPWARETVDGIPVLRVASYLSHNRNGLQRALSYLSFAAASLLALPLLRFRPSVVYIYNLVTLIPVASVARALWGSKVVLDVQDLWPESVTASGMMKRGRWMRFLGNLCDRAYRVVDRVIAQSPGFAAKLAERGVMASRVQVIYNWAPSEREASPAAMSRAPSHFHVVYAGNVGTVQALDIVIESARRCKETLPQVRFSIIGGGTDVERLRELARGLSNVEIHGWKSPERLDPFLANASALLLHLADAPVFRITIPSKLQQYLQAGRPILCGVSGDATKLVNEAGAGIAFTPGDSADLVAKLGEMVKMQPLDRQEMGTRGAEYYWSRLARDRGLAEMESVLKAAQVV